MGNELATQNRDLSVQGETNLSMVQRLKERINTIQYAYREIMVKDVDYGVIPGCGTKPALMKAGAEKLMLAFRIAPTFMETTRDLGSMHREVSVKCTLTDNNGSILGEGLGCCSTLESKYRYRNVADYEILETPIPKDSKEKKSEYRKQGFGMKMVDGVWYWVKYLDSVKSENPDPADQWNTVLKMAKKRSLVDAALTVLGASDIFTQDIDEQKPENAIPPKQPQRTFKVAFEELKGKAISPEAVLIFSGIVNGYLEKFKVPSIEKLTESDYEVLVKEIKGYKAPAKEEKKEEVKA